MKRKLFIPILLFLFIASCGTFNVNLTPTSMYTSVRSLFNNYYETYLNFRDAMPEGTDKEILKDDMQPLFDRGVEILDAWKLVVGTSEGDEKLDMMNNLLDQIVIAMYNHGIIDKKEVSYGGRTSSLAGCCN